LAVVIKEHCEKWVIIPLEVTSLQIVQIDYLIPANVLQCTGVTVSISGVNSFYLPTRFGEVSLSFNNRASQPVHLPANWIPYRKRLDQILYKLEEPIIKGTRVTGYFRNIVEFPYSVQICLQCVSVLKAISQT
jgi:hypothetical protein